MRNSRIQDLKDVQIKKLVRNGVPGRTAVGGVPGLSIDVSGPGVAKWVLRLQGKRNTTLGLGSFSSVSLSQARELARKVRAAIEEGKDPKCILNPSSESENAKGTTAKELFPRWIDECERSKKWKHVDDYLHARQRLNNYISPAIGDMPVSEVTPRDIGEKILTPVINSGKVGTADKLRSLLNQFFTWCDHEGLLDTSKRFPTDKTLISGYLPARRIIKAGRSHHPMCPVDMLPDLVAELVKPERFLNIGPMAFLFSILTNSRLANVVSTHVVKNNYAAWSDIDMAKRLWIIPAEKMKVPGNGPHIVPLNNAAMLILERLVKLGKKQNNVVFPNKNSGPLSDGVFRKLIKEINNNRRAAGLPEFLDPETKKPITQHGTARATFMTWCEDNGISDRIAEKALHHEADKRLGHSYDRSKAIEPRRELAQQWADYCLSKAPKDWNAIKLR